MERANSTPVDKVNSAVQFDKGIVSFNLIAIQPGIMSFHYNKAIAHNKPNDQATHHNIDEGPQKV